MRIIGHLDMDAFFAAVEERDNPRFSGKPIVVGADPDSSVGKGKGRGVVSTANYKAREYGIKSAMPISFAWQASEDAVKKGKEPVIFLLGNYDKYSRVSLEIMSIVRKYSDSVEEASIDEAYFDLSFVGSYEKAEKICQEIKNEIKRKERLTASIGIGPNKLIAKIASDIKKPDGLTVILESEAEKFLEPLFIRKIPGIGPKTEIQLNKFKIFKVIDLKKLSKEKLSDIFGKWGEGLFYKIRGIDDSPIIEECEVKSIGEQETFKEDSLDSGYIIKRLSVLCENVFESFEKSNFNSFKTVVITVRFSNFETKTKSFSLNTEFFDKKTFHFEAMRLITPFFDTRFNPKKLNIRLIGVRIEKLS